MITVSWIMGATINLFNQICGDGCWTFNQHILCITLKASGRQKRKKGVGCGSRRQENYESGRQDYGRIKIWDPRIKRVFQDNTFRKRCPTFWVALSETSRRDDTVMTPELASSELAPLGQLRWSGRVFFGMARYYGVSADVTALFPQHEHDDTTIPSSLTGYCDLAVLSLTCLAYSRKK
ncbi:hypothetical protein Tco_0888324 [Tanacetum coccineum]